MTLNGTFGSPWSTRILGALLCSGVTAVHVIDQHGLSLKGATPPANAAPCLTPAPAPQIPPSGRGDASGHTTEPGRRPTAIGKPHLLDRQVADPQPLGGPPPPDPPPDPPAVRKLLI